MSAFGEGEENAPEKQRRRRRLWGSIVTALLLTVAVVVAVAEIMLYRALPILQGRIEETLSTRFDGRVQLGALDVSFAKGLAVSGHGLRIYPPDEVVAAGAKEPLIRSEQFSFHVNLKGFFLKPMHVGTVHVRGMTINIPPREVRQQAVSSRRLGKITIVVDEIDCEDSKLIIETARPDKDPHEFDLDRIVMRNVGPNDPWRYDATLINAIPTGKIQAQGTFGPWLNDAPADSAVTGKYIFENADLGTIRGIGGTLSSTGKFSGQLNNITVDGTTETPDFALDTADHPVPLRTEFHAIVDGTSGDTYLQPVNAKLKRSELSCTGSIISVKGIGHEIDLDVDAPRGRIEDFLELAVKQKPVLMTGQLAMKTKLHIRPGVESVTKKLNLSGGFRLRSIHFSNPEWQDKVDMFSLRAQGEPKQAKPGAEDVASQMTGTFAMGDRRLRFSRLNYSLPGADVNLAGVYSLDGNDLDFNGKVRTKATLSQMVASRWKSIVLKPVDPFFHKNGAGAEIPVKISGTRGAPKFGLNLKHKDRSAQ